MKLLTFVNLVAAIASATAFVPTHHFSSPTHGMPSLFMAESIEEATEDATERMEKSVESVLQNMNSIRTGRASPAILDRVKADYYGVQTPISQMASISVPSAQQLTVEPFDKSVLGDIERAIVEADLGLTPQNDGSLIRLNIPSLTEERRKEMVKQCKAIGEEGKVAIRNVRRKTVESIKKLEKSGDIGEDESKSSQEDVQKMTDAKVKEIDEIVGRKEKEVETI
jgi:ribosome recycling factor